MAVESCMFVEGCDIKTIEPMMLHHKLGNVVTMRVKKTASRMTIVVVARPVSTTPRQIFVISWSVWRIPVRAERRYHTMTAVMITSVTIAVTSQPMARGCSFERSSLVWYMVTIENLRCRYISIWITVTTETVESTYMLVSIKAPTLHPKPATASGWGEFTKLIASNTRSTTLTTLYDR
jgi:hypothetical protein